MHASRDATHEDAGRVCPFCRFPLKSGAAVTQCRACSALHHTECWEDNHGCAITGCPGGPSHDDPSWAAPPTPAAAPPPPPATPGRAGRGLAAALVLLAIAIAAVAVAIAITRSGAGQQAAAPATTPDSRPDAPAPTPTATPEITPTATPEITPTATPEEIATPVPPVPVKQPIRFHTGTDAGKAMPATYCRITSDALYCWTPNDGYTLRLGSGAPVRVRADEQANKRRLPGGYDLLAPGRTRSRYGFRCTSRSSGLSCQSASGHGWTLPRYVGLPALY